METIEVKVYSVYELEEDVQDKVFEKYFDWNVNFDWWDFLLEDWKNKLAAEGFWDAKIYFSGFWSQGDGAVFTAAVDDSKLFEKFLIDSGRKVTGWIMSILNFHTIEIERTHLANHYCHEKTAEVVGYYGLHTRHTKRVDALFSEFEAFVEDLRLELCQDIFSSLEKAYDYLTSKEAVLESLDSEGCRFLDDGTML